MAERNQEIDIITSENTLVIIPASSDGGEIPTTLLALNGKPLICYTIDIARQIAENIEICVATSEIDIIKVVNEYGLFVPFMLPNKLYAKVLDIDEAVLHVIDHYARKEVNFDKIVLLSPRSPFCKVEYIQEAANLLEEDVEMVAGVKTLAEPKGRYYLTENEEGYLQKHSDIPKFEKSAIYKYNNAFSILKTRAIRQYPRSFFRRIRKYVMDKKGSVFIKNAADIVRCEEILSKSAKPNN